MPSVLKMVTLFSERCFYNMVRPSCRRNQKDQKEQKKKMESKNVNISAENIIHVFLAFTPDSASPALA